MQRIVVGTDQIEGTLLWLTADQKHYLQRVLRLRIGDRFLALSGAGDMWMATLTTNGQAHLSIAPNNLAIPKGRSKPHITLAASLPKQGFDDVVRQVTELGVAKIVPIFSDRTLLRPSPNKLERWRKIATEAGEQSERLVVPIVSEPLAWSDWIRKESQDFRYLCVARQTAPSLLAACLAATVHSIEVAVGPEGGWTDPEVTDAIAYGYKPVSLGSSILRAVTASVAALAILQAGFDFATVYKP